MEEALRAILLASSSVTALCGTRVDFGANAQGVAMPRIVMWTISDNEGATYTGPDGLSQGRVQVDIYATTYASAKLLSRAVIAALHTYRGGNFLGVFHDGTRESREGGTNEADRPFRVSLDFLTNWSEQ